MKKINFCVFLLISLLLSACGGDDLEYVPSQEGGGGESSYTPPVSTGGGENPPPKEEDPPKKEVCEATPAVLDLRSYNGCQTSSRFAVTIREGGEDSFFPGKSFKDSQGRTGELVYLVDESEAASCGEVGVVTVSNSGSIDFTMDQQVHSYRVSEELTSVVWQRLHGGTPPTVEDLYGKEFTSLVLDTFECLRGFSCPLPPEAGTPLGNTFVYQGKGESLEADGAFCGRTIILMTNKR